MLYIIYTYVSYVNIYRILISKHSYLSTFPLTKRTIKWDKCLVVWSVSYFIFQSAIEARADNKIIDAKRQFRRQSAKDLKGLSLWLVSWPISPM